MTILYSHESILPSLFTASPYPTPNPNPNPKVDAGQTAEADSPTSLDGTDGISQLSPSSPASVVDESLLLASQGTAGEFS